ncbi:MAG: hypothetical protein LUE87_00885 [Lachnospiraceae bacterium]|nr:hypothetical protein [Lachnospiraceae bacterium]
MTAGIDIGTSSVKMLLEEEGKISETFRFPYEGNTLEEICRTILKALKEAGRDVEAISLSSQTGTYVIDKSELISWQSDAGCEEIEGVISSFSPETFISEISMPHPRIFSYPLPRIKYILARHPHVKSICQLKDAVLYFLTGEYKSDVYTWRGLANVHTGKYSQKMLDYAGAAPSLLPGLHSPFSVGGYMKEEISRQTGVRIKTPVYIGLNDYYASLLGMGISSPGQAFDITGTSEHVGCIIGNIEYRDWLVTSPYLKNQVCYGVTASSGNAMDYGMDNFPMEEINMEKSVLNQAPVFLPYLKGERSPIYNSGARGVFFGISDKTTRQDMAYSVLEGAAFAAYHIFSEIPSKSACTCVMTSGGPAKNKNYNRLKASLWGVPFKTMAVNDTSALGAVMCSLLGMGKYGSFREAAAHLCKVQEVIPPEETAYLRKRFELYKKIYQSNIDNFSEFRRISV